jgi:hypothetical protein
MRNDADDDPQDHQIPAGGRGPDGQRLAAYFTVNMRGL